MGYTIYEVYSVKMGAILGRFIDIGAGLVWIWHHPAMLALRRRSDGFFGYQVLGLVDTRLCRAEKGIISWCKPTMMELNLIKDRLADPAFQTVVQRHKEGDNIEGFVTRPLPAGTQFIAGDNTRPPHFILNGQTVDIKQLQPIKI